MNKRNSTIWMKVLEKLFISAVFFTLIGFYGCKKEQLAPYKTKNPVGTSKVAQNSVPCGTPLVTDLIAGQNLNAGTVTVYNTQDSLYILIQTTGNWKITSSKIYVGSLAAMPQTPQGSPKVGQFPYKKNFNPSVTSAMTVVPLNGLSPCYIIAAHVDLTEIVNGTVVQTQTGWANGSPLPGANWAMYLNYCTQACNPCIYNVQTQDLFAGQTINVGTVEITNDADSLYITYNLTGSWYFRQIHVYVGTLAGMPINSQNAPIPGQFPINQMIIGNTTQSLTFAYPLAGLPPCYVIAAHASVFLTDIHGDVIQTETAWGFGDPFQNTNRWGWTIPYCTQICE